MALPMLAMAALKYGPAVIGTLQGLFKGKSKEEKAREAALGRISKIAESGLDRGVLDRAIGIINSRIGNEQQGTLARLASGGLDPSSGLAQEAVGAVRRSRGAREGEARSLFDEQSQRAQMEANQYLAGLPVQQDDSLSQSLSSIGTSLVEDFSKGGLFNKTDDGSPSLPAYQDIRRFTRKNIPRYPQPVGMP